MKFIVVTSAKEDNVGLIVVVGLSVSNFAQELPIGFA